MKNTHAPATVWWLDLQLGTTVRNNSSGGNVGVINGIDLRDDQYRVTIVSPLTANHVKCVSVCC
jgi:hypothetical protein